MALDEYQGYSSLDWQRTAQTTLAKHFARVEEAMLRDYRLGALLQSNGRLMMNQAGRGFDWDVQYRIHDLETYTGETQIVYQRKNLWKKAYLDYRGYHLTDAMFEREFLENRGREAQIKVFSKMVDRLETSAKQRFADQYWIDGNASGNEQRWHGIKSFLGCTQTIDITDTNDTTARTANAADPVGYPNDTYAGLSTVPGNYDGAQSTGSVWPNGTADPEFDFFTPLIINYTSTYFGGASATWAAQGDEAMRFANIHAHRNQLPRSISHVFLARGLYYEFLNLIDDKERIVVERGGPMDLVSLGFGDTVRFDGVQVTHEVSVPDGEGFGLNVNNIDLLCMYDRFLKTEGPNFDRKSRAFEAGVFHLGNLKFKSPRNFYHLRALA